MQKIVFTIFLICGITISSLYAEDESIWDKVKSTTSTLADKTKSVFSSDKEKDDKEDESLLDKTKKIFSSSKKEEEEEDDESFLDKSKNYFKKIKDSETVETVGEKSKSFWEVTKEKSKDLYDKVKDD